MKIRAIAGVAILASATTLAFAQQPVTIKLVPENHSGETGTATLTSQGDQTKVEIILAGEPKGITQPAHIHEGTCAKLNPNPMQGLQSVVDGKSTTVIPVSLDKLLKGDTAINVHKSADDLKTYVACGKIARAEGKK